MFSILFIMLAAVCNAIQDTLAHHHATSIFKNHKTGFWSDANLVSWKNKYIDGDPKKGFRKLFWKINYPTFLTDAWHFFKSSSICLFCAAIVLYKPVLGPLIDFVIVGVIWNIAFNICYNRIFVKK